MVYAGTSYEGPKWRGSIAPRAFLGRSKALSRAVLVTVAAILVALSLALVAPAAEAHYRRVACNAGALRPFTTYGAQYPVAVGTLSCSTWGYWHEFEIGLWKVRHYYPDAHTDWVAYSTSTDYVKDGTSARFWSGRGDYYTYTTIAGHDATQSSFRRY